MTKETENIYDILEKIWFAGYDVAHVEHGDATFTPDAKDKVIGTAILELIELEESLLRINKVTGVNTKGVSDV